MIPLLLLSKGSKSIEEFINKEKINNLFTEVIPSTKEYSIDDIKNIKKEVRVYHPNTRIYYFPDFHLSSIPAQNSFLKLLEEPPANVQFILSTDNKNNLLPTIISRVKIVKLQESEKLGNINKFIFDVTKISLSQFKIADKESAKKVLLQLIEFFQTKLDSDKKAPTIIKEILRLNSLLETNNLNPQLTVDQVLIFIYKIYKINQEVKIQKAKVKN